MTHLINTVYLRHSKKCKVTSLYISMEAKHLYKLKKSLYTITPKGIQRYSVLRNMRWAGKWVELEYSILSELTLAKEKHYIFFSLICGAYLHIFRFLFLSWSIYRCLEARKEVWGGMRCYRRIVQHMPGENIEGAGVGWLISKGLNKCGTGVAEENSGHRSLNQN